MNGYEEDATTEAPASEESPGPTQVEYATTSYHMSEKDQRTAEQVIKPMPEDLPKYVDSTQTFPSLNSVFAGSVLASEKAVAN